jgi:SAM-dependent methyltransferase
LAEAGASQVVGVDINPRWLRIARESELRSPSDGRVAFVDRLDGNSAPPFDIVVSRDSMEHFTDPEGCLQAIRQSCRPDGFIFLTFGPPWYAPYGSHMQFFTGVPWINLLFSEATIINVRSHFRSDGARRYEEVESGLNRMSVARFERLIAGSGLVVMDKKYYCVKGWRLRAAVCAAFINSRLYPETVSLRTGCRHRPR